MAAPTPRPEPLIRKCVVPAAGLGTCFLPATKASVAYALERPELCGPLLEWPGEIVRTEKS